MRTLASIVAGLVLVACVPAGTGRDAVEITALPIVDAADWRDPWERTEAGGARTIEIVERPTTVEVVAGERVESVVGLHAVDRLVAPTLDGRLLVDELPPGSAFVLRPDGTATFTLWDLFDPRWRGRVPRWQPVADDGEVFDVDPLDGPGGPAKVGTWAEPGDLGFFREPDGTTGLYVLGRLDACVRIGRPIRAVDLRDPTGSHPTTLRDVPEGTELWLGSGDGDLVLAWTAEASERVEPLVELPAELVGIESLCWSIVVPDGRLLGLEEFHLTVTLEAADLVSLTEIDGRAEVHYDDAAESDARAILWWGDPRVAIGHPEADPPAATTVVEGSDELTVAFPDGSRLVLALDERGEPTSVSRLDLVGLPALGAPVGEAVGLPAVIEVEGEPPPGPGFDWVPYRDVFLRARGWTSRGERRTVVRRGTFEGIAVEGAAARLTWRLDDGTTLRWILTPTVRELGGTRFAGLASRWATDDRRAVAVAAQVPIRPVPGEREIHQSFRHLHEAGTALVGPGARPRVTWFTSSQSFLFRTAPGRTFVAAFVEPAAATVTTRFDAGRELHDFEIPLRDGTTSTLEWLVVDRGTADRYLAADLWARVYEDLVAAYQEVAGIVDTPALPTLEWNRPSDDDFLAALERHVETGEYPAAGEGWFDVFAAELDRVAEAGIANVIVQAPWVSDAEDPAVVGSLHAPRDLRVSELLGGEAALGRLVAAAQERDIEVTLWWPSAYAIRAPIFVEDPDRLVWTSGGVPDDGGWGDILVVDNSAPYRRWATSRLAELHARIPFDGLWLDSWDGIAVPTDFSDPLPTPRLDDALALQAAFGELGLRLVVEGLAPLGRSDAYGDYEVYEGPANPLPEHRRTLEAIRGREYLLYRLGTGVGLDVDVYARTFAAGGAVKVANLDEVAALDDDDFDRFRRINRAIVAVGAERSRRSLVVADGRWIGVAWPGAGDELVVFAFEPFAVETDGPTDVVDVAEDERRTEAGPIVLEPYHVYVLDPAG
ncbi:MAG TPA: hypothetical protein ENK55_02005 [Actinobacteria bacterium]|nr:hypothetical protein [Actinomycetota bacterium]